MNRIGRVQKKATVDARVAVQPTGKNREQDYVANNSRKMEHCSVCQMTHRVQFYKTSVEVTHTLSSEEF